MLKFLYNTKTNYLSINKQKIELKQKIFFLKVWTKNVSAHYTRDHTAKIQ